jgi:hypothetical protein
MTEKKPPHTQRVEPVTLTVTISDNGEHYTVNGGAPRLTQGWVTTRGWKDGTHVGGDRVFRQARLTKGMKELGLGAPRGRAVPGATYKVTTTLPLWLADADGPAALSDTTENLWVEIDGEWIPVEGTFAPPVPSRAMERELSRLEAGPIEYKGKGWRWEVVKELERRGLVKATSTGAGLTYELAKGEVKKNPRGFSSSFTKPEMSALLIIKDFQDRGEKLSPTDMRLGYPHGVSIGMYYTLREKGAIRIDNDLDSVVVWGPGLRALSGTGVKKNPRKTKAKAKKNPCLPCILALNPGAKAKTIVLPSDLFEELVYLEVDTYDGPYGNEGRDRFVAAMQNAQTMKSGEKLTVDDVTLRYMVHDNGALYQHQDIWLDNIQFAYDSEERKRLRKLLSQAKRSAAKVKKLLGATPAEAVKPKPAVRRVSPPLAKKNPLKRAKGTVKKAKGAAKKAKSNPVKRGKGVLTRETLMQPLNAASTIYIEVEGEDPTHFRLAKGDVPLDVAGRWLEKTYGPGTSLSSTSRRGHAPPTAAVLLFTSVYQGKKRTDLVEFRLK